MSAPDAGANDALQRLWDRDVTKILVTFLALYVAYVVLGLISGLSTQGILATLVQVTLLILLYAMLTLSLNLHWGYTGLFNIGIVGFMAVGAYTAIMLSKPPATATAGAVFGGFGLPFSVGLIGGTIAAALLGLLVALPALRLRADYLAIVTIAMAEIVRFTYRARTFQDFSVFGYDVGTGGGRGLLINFDDPLAGYVFGSEVFSGIVRTLNGALGISGNLRPVVETATVCVVLAVVVVGYFLLFKRTGESPFGRVLKAIREDEDVARALGKDTRQFKIKAFMLGCAMMGLAGALYTYYFVGQANPRVFRPRTTFFVWVALIIGGAGSNTGSVIGSALFVGVLFRGPLYVKNVIESLVTIGDAPPTIAGAIAGFLALDAMPFVAFVFEKINLFRIIALGVVLVWLMKRRPEGLLGHRRETAASIPLGPVDRPDPGGGSEAATDGGPTAETGGDRS